MLLRIPYLLIVKILLVVGLAGTLYWQATKINKLELQVSQQSINIKSYMEGMQTYYTQGNVLHAQVISQQQTIAALTASKDQTQHALMDSLKKWKIAKRSVTQLEQTVNQLHNEKVIPIATVQGKLVDSTFDLSDKPYIEETVQITHDSTGYKLKRDLVVDDTETRAWHNVKETINTPSKVFFIRWFQKKQLVEYEDIVHSNPYMKVVKEQYTHVIK